MLAPVPGPAKFTVIPWSGSPLASFTIATSGCGKVVFTVALWFEPLTTETEAGTAPFWVIVMDWPRIAMCAVRAEVDALAVNEKLTTPFETVPIVQPGLIAGRSENVR